MEELYYELYGLSAALTKCEMRMQLKQMFLDNRELLLAWMEGDRAVKLAHLRTLGFYLS